MEYATASRYLRNYLFLLIFFLVVPDHGQSQQFFEDCQSDTSGDVSTNDGSGPQGHGVIESPIEGDADGKVDVFVDFVHVEGRVEFVLKEGGDDSSQEEPKGRHDQPVN
jgi:hypothetical protein